MIIVGLFTLDHRLNAMPKPKPEDLNKPRPARSLRAQLELLTAQLRDQQRVRCTFSDCPWASDGLRLSQEVDILQKQNEALRRENEELKQQFEVGE